MFASCEPSRTVTATATQVDPKKLAHYAGLDSNILGLITDRTLSSRSSDHAPACHSGSGNREAKPFNGPSRRRVRQACEAVAGVGAGADAVACTLSHEAEFVAKGTSVSGFFAPPDEQEIWVSG